MSSEVPAFQPLTGIYEPSAVQQLPQGKYPASLLSNRDDDLINLVGTNNFLDPAVGPQHSIAGNQDRLRTIQWVETDQRQTASMHGA